MLTQTSETAVRLLMHIGRQAAGSRTQEAGQQTDKVVGPVAVHEVAQRIGAAPPYTAKIVGGLVQAGILHSQRGAGGGVSLARQPQEISLLDVVLACQSVATETYCQPPENVDCAVCAFHAAMRELHESIHAVLGRWTLADLLANPVGRYGDEVNSACLMMPRLG